MFHIVKAILPRSAITYSLHDIWGPWLIWKFLLIENKALSLNQRDWSKCDKYMYNNAVKDLVLKVYICMYIVTVLFLSLHETCEIISI